MNWHIAVIRRAWRPRRLSITQMRSEIMRDASLMPFIVCTTWLTTLPPRIATVDTYDDGPLRVTQVRQRRSRQALAGG